MYFFVVLFSTDRSHSNLASFDYNARLKYMYVRMECFLSGCQSIEPLLETELNPIGSGLARRGRGKSVKNKNKNNSTKLVDSTLRQTHVEREMNSLYLVLWFQDP